METPRSLQHIIVGIPHKTTCAMRALLCFRIISDMRHHHDNTTENCDNNNKNNNKKAGVPWLKEGLLLDGRVPKGGRAELEKSIVLFQMQYQRPPNLVAYTQNSCKLFYLLFTLLLYCCTLSLYWPYNNI